jgi:hypothetical protein
MQESIKCWSPKSGFCCNLENNLGTRIHIASENCTVMHAHALIDMAAVHIGRQCNITMPRTLIFNTSQKTSMNA